MPGTVEELQARLDEAEELLRAIRSGGVDALVVSGPHGDQVYTLSGAEHPYRVMVETMSDGALILAADGTIIYSNGSFAAMLDMPLEDVIGSPMDRFVLAEDLPRYHALIQQTQAGSASGELRLARKHGAVLSVQLSISSFTDEGPNGACVVVTDLTQHKRHQELISAEALERAKRAEAEAGHERMRGILESITESFFSVDRSWHITEANQRAAVKLGRSRDALLGSFLWDLVLDDAIPELEEQYRRVMTERVAAHFEGPSAAVPGQWLERHMYPTDEGLAVYFRDITERKLGEAALLQAKEEAERRAREAEEAQSILHSILDNAPIGITLAGGPPEFPIIANSKYAATMIGRPSESLLNIPAGVHAEAYGLLLPDDIHPRPEQLPLYRASRHGELVENEEWILERPDGSRICVLSNVAPIRDYHGRIIGAINCWHDVTASKREQESLRASEERFRRYFDLGLIGMAITSPAMGFVEVNDELCRIFGYERAELLSMTWRELTYPDDLLADVDQFKRVMSGAISGYSMDKRYIHKDGRIIHSIMAVQCVRRADGAVDYFVGLVQDITERKIWEERLRRSEAMLSTGQRISHTGSWVWNVVTDDLFWSDEHFRISGVDPESFMLTRETARQLIHPDDRAAANQAFDAAVRDRSVFEHQLRMLRPDGSVRFVLSLGYPVFDDAGELSEYVGTVMDITDRKESERVRAELLRRLVGAQEDERRRIAIEMHDQFGQQLSALVLQLAGLRREQGQRTNLGQQLASLEEITRRLDTDLELIVWRLRPPSLDDLGLIAALAHYVERWSEHFGVRAELQSSGMEAGGVIEEIDTALYRIAQEALNNVAKHAQAKSVAVHLDRRADRVSLIVEDDGIGFQAEQRMGARQRFGLVGMRERATLLGGTLDIESRPGNGTTVAVRIPIPPYRQEGIP